MNECDTCGSTVDTTDNFCAACGEPQNKKAKQRIKQLHDKLFNASSTGTHNNVTLKLPNQIKEYEQLVIRISYAIGALSILSGVSLAPSIASIFLILGGILFLPPTRLLLGQVIGRSPKFTVTIGFSTFVILLGIIVTVLF